MTPSPPLLHQSRLIAGGDADVSSIPAKTAARDLGVEPVEIIADMSRKERVDPILEFDTDQEKVVVLTVGSSTVIFGFLKLADHTAVKLASYAVMHAPIDDRGLGIQGKGGLPVSVLHSDDVSWVTVVGKTTLHIAFRGIGVSQGGIDIGSRLVSGIRIIGVFSVAGAGTKRSCELR